MKTQIYSIIDNFDLVFEEKEQTAWTWCDAPVCVQARQVSITWIIVLKDGCMLRERVFAVTLRHRTTLTSGICVFKCQRRLTNY